MWKASNNRTIKILIIIKIIIIIIIIIVLKIQQSDKKCE